MCVWTSVRSLAHAWVANVHIKTSRVQVECVRLTMYT